MDELLTEKFKSLAKIGTFFHALPLLSQLEGGTYVAQLRRLRGEHYSLYLDEQRRLSQALRGIKPDQVAPPTEEERRAIQKSIEAMRQLLLASVVRVYRVGADGEAPTPFRPVNTAAGDHDDDEISLDLLEADYLGLTHELLVRSGLLVRSPESFPGPDHAGDPGPGGEAVRTAAEQPGEGIPAGPAV